MRQSVPDLKKPTVQLTRAHKGKHTFSGKPAGGKLARAEETKAELKVRRPLQGSLQKKCGRRQRSGGVLQALVKA